MRKGKYEETEKEARVETKKNLKKSREEVVALLLAYNLSDLSGLTKNMKVPSSITCKIIETILDVILKTFP